jgi:hypothetical protein
VHVEPKTKSHWWIVAVSLPYAVVYLLLYSVWVFCLHVVIWIWWCARGRDVLFVYSESPLWREYIERQLLPILAQRAVILNWSERSAWSFSLGRAAFRHFGGSREFNPMAVVFRPLRRTRTFRFWKPFRELNRGRPQALEVMEAELLQSVGISRTS